MTPEQQRIAIAEACGWKPTARTIGQSLNEAEWQDMVGEPMEYWLDPPYSQYPRIPDYLSDLNAMHAAIDTLSEKQIKRMWGYLLEIMGDDPKRPAWRAKPEELAEAYLRTIDKWVAA